MFFLRRRRDRRLPGGPSRGKRLPEPSELTLVPLVGERRAEVFHKEGITSISQLAGIDSTDMRFRKHPCLIGVLPLIKNYARAIVEDKPLVTGKHPFFEDVSSKNVCFFDAEYNPQGTRSGPYGIFLIGLMDANGNVEQMFLEEAANERDILQSFNEWLLKHRSILVSYGSVSADRPHLLNAFRRFGLPTDLLGKSFFDLYYECLNTQRERHQAIFLPMRGSMSIKKVSTHLGYREPSLAITDGLHALVQYDAFLKTKNHSTREDLLQYNRSDLERCAFVFREVCRIFERGC
jgi:predicted RecB family nuclease